jgi:alkanesulfonate monooxygenase SsuD/methylene tetrahydromethanopterin reductase-like flavin-dependent oxidoreductase (luciferase family)
VQRSLVFASSHWEPLPVLASEAEQAGLYRVWTTEGPRRDALVRATALLSATKTIRVGTGVVLAFQRSPIATGMAAADLSALSGGRFTLGLSPGSRGVRRAHGEPDIASVGTWFREYVAVVRLACDTSASRIHYEGEYFRADVPSARMAEVGSVQPPEIYGGGLNPAMLRNVGRACDGLALLSIGCAAPYLEEVAMPAWRVGAAGTARDAAAWCITSIDDDLERARAEAKRQLAFYFSTPSYRAPAVAAGFGQAVANIQELFRSAGSPAWQRLAEAVPDPMVDAFTVTATPHDAPELLARWEERLSAAGVTEIVLQVPAALGEADYLSYGRRAIAAAGTHAGETQ